MNNVQLQGKLSRDCHISETKSGGKMCFMTVQATREGGSDFLPVKAFGMADTMIPLLTKGAEVCVTGRLQAGKYDKGLKKQLYENVVVAEEIRCAGGDGRSGGSWNASAFPAAAPAAAPVSAGN